MKRRSFLGGLIASVAAFIPGVSLLKAATNKDDELYQNVYGCAWPLASFKNMDHMGTWLLAGYLCHDPYTQDYSVAYELTFEGRLVSCWHGNFSQPSPVSGLTCGQFNQLRVLDNWTMYRSFELYGPHHPASTVDDVIDYDCNQLSMLILESWAPEAFLADLDCRAGLHTDRTEWLRRMAESHFGRRINKTYFTNKAVQARYDAKRNAIPYRQEVVGCAILDHRRVLKADFV